MKSDTLHQEREPLYFLEGYGDCIKTFGKQWRTAMEGNVSCPSPVAEGTQGKSPTVPLEAGGEPEALFVSLADSLEKGKASCSFLVSSKVELRKAFP